MKILVLCLYPIKKPTHGGQLRVSNIVDAYRSVGHEVQVVGVLSSEHYPKEDGFLPFPGTQRLTKIIPNPFLMEDYAIGRLVVESEAFFFSLSNLITIKPDLIEVEHPWLFQFAMQYRNRLVPSAKIIYSSHNIEWRLKEEIVNSYMGSEIAAKYADLIREVEFDAIRNADAVIAVSQSDQDWLVQNTNRPVVLAPNGVKPWNSTEAGRAEAAAITRGYRYALYCASAHPPNVTGFFQMFSGGFGCLKPDEKLVVAGAAGWAIAEDVRLHHSAKLAEKIVVAGIVSQPCLEGLLDGAHCIVLPLTQGGGTNLKTAEALWSGKYMVATTVAMRGFERFINMRGITVADEPATFKRALRESMSRAPLVLDAQDIELRRSVLWESCLSSLPPLLGRLREERGL